MESPKRRSCPVCGDEAYRSFLHVGAVPVHVGALWESREQARSCPRGELDLAFCPGCGFIGNAAFEPERVDYEVRYDNALHFSSVFQKYERALAERLVARYGLAGRDVLEIGCGGGHFLGLLCELGARRGFGFDPSHDPANADSAVGERVTVAREHFDARHADRAASLVCCRHVLEHLPDPRGFLRGLRGALAHRPETVVYFEVPNAYLILRELSIWDLIYEHCLYFVPETLGYLFRSCGFELLDLHEAYHGQFIGLEARPLAEGAERRPPERPDTAELAREVEAFAGHFRERREAWQRRIAALREEGRRVVVWGAGAKAVGFLNLLELGDLVDRIVDINPGKQGSFLAGSGQPIVAPEELRKDPPDAVVVVNPVYREEIAAELRRQGLAPELWTV